MKIYDKIFLKEATDLLGFSNKPMDYVVHVLINEENLTTYFDLNVDATVCKGYEVRQINQEGDELPYVDSEPPTTIEGSGKKILEADVIGKAILSVTMFEHKGKQYCGADNDGTLLKSIDLSFDYIYFEKSEINAIQDLPPYQDENHKHYAPELDLAIQLHKAIYTEKYGNLAQSREDRIRSWLNSEYQQYEFSEAAITRLSAVIGNKPLKYKKK
ncbi:MAG: hypothetical protein JAY74_25465 [Candidatus Thiodiazotropha taylori]|nr:hypothetical protein [Candidatus Thiodiazotropha taylori]